ncbi:hypothetical protein [Streptomyces sp. KR80]|uniref:hypothetical protein n=1 Tax=Streptomyces sp. KR80 TaxID=3457426 RepID=UPI003FD1F21E
MKFRQAAVAAVVAAGLALSLGSGTASASSAYKFRGGKAWFQSKGEILKVYDTKAGRTGIYVIVEDTSAKNPTYDDCAVKGKGKVKTCNMSFKNGHKLQFTVFSYRKLSDHSTRKYITSYTDRA